MRRHELTETQWELVSSLIPRRRGRISSLGDRNFVNAVVWIAKTGAPWRDLPERFGPWKTIFNRFSEWAKAERWDAIFKALALTDDEVGCLIDGSVIRAHQDSCGGDGGPKKTQ
jgi:transposase